jgi:hypothetical protein
MRTNILKSIDFNVTAKGGAGGCTPSVPAAPKYSVTASIRGTVTVTKTASRTISGPLANDDRPDFATCYIKLPFHYTEHVDSGDIVKSVTFDSPSPNLIPITVDNFVQEGNTVTVNGTVNPIWQIPLGSTCVTRGLFRPAEAVKRTIMFDRIEHVSLETEPHML